VRYEKLRIFSKFDLILYNSVSSVVLFVIATGMSVSSKYL